MESVAGIEVRGHHLFRVLNRPVVVGAYLNPMKFIGGKAGKGAH